MISAHRAALAGLAALALGMGIGRFAYTPLLPALIEEAGLGLRAAGYIASANFAGYLIGALAASRIPAHRRRTAYAAAIGLSILTTFSLAVLVSPWLLALARALSGVASAFVMVQGSAIVLDILGAHRRPGLFAALYAGVGAGIALTAAIVEIMARAGASGAGAWAALGLVSALLAWPALGLRDPGRAGGASLVAPATGPPASARARALRWLLLAYGGLGFGYVITATFIVVMVRSRPEWKPYEMLVWCIVGLAAAPSNWFWQRLSERASPWIAMIAAYLLEALGVAAAALGEHLLAVFLGALLLGGTFMAITALGLTTARGLSGGASTQVVGRMTAAFGLGQILGPAIGGWLAERSGSFVAPSLLAVAVLVACAGLLALAARQLAASGTA
ncbi:MAG: YbfB/YjiJ family MFS transporter [Burkholderiaceae bacterium]|nr:YbfB/YjiJ family MFS transporter [Burkholderiaceae bacterium]